MSHLDQQWYIRTPIEDGEVFSSWLIRSALDIGCSPLTLIEALWGKWRGLTIDLDRGITTERLDSLLQHCFESKLDIQQTMLRSYIPYFYDEFDQPCNPIPWILSLGIRNRSNISGRQLCTVCLKDPGSSPYLRLKWRMGWHCCCEKHQVRLIDYCPECGISIQPFKIDLEHGSLAVCSLCKYDFRSFQSLRSDSNALSFQMDADSVMETGTGLYDQCEISSVEWFAIARSWLSEIRALVTSQNMNLIKMFKSLGIDLDILKPITPLAFEYLNTNERTYLLSILRQIMSVPCSLIVQYSYDYDISKANFWDKRKNLPIQLQQMKDAMIRPTRHSVSIRAASSVNRPKSKAFVQRKYLKFLRKLNRNGSGYFD